MRGLHSTISRLAKLRAAANDSGRSDGRLSELAEFGPNPGNLRALTYIPEGLDKGAALVVVLHGCTQNAGDFDRGSGWSELADRHGFTLLYPEQKRRNNANLCFNWFVPGDARRGKGEARSIAQMVAHLAKTRNIDPDRVFVTGLSAGGAMTAVMLASYPEIFAGGAVIAGLPFATANSVSDALERMRGSGGPGATALASRAARASPQPAQLPTLSVWHGSADHVVAPSNGDDLIAQWRALHGIGEAPARVETVDGHRRQTWTDATGRPVIEHYEIAGLGHGVPLSTRGKDGVGEPGPHMFEAGISSTRHAADFWGLLGKERMASNPRAESVTPPRRPSASRGGGVQGVIENALRRTGLMR